ncbi:uncharacterized protein LOC127123003 [Lathyrus oleraceus]|uniref:uncharacterized protein LOC127123003 n=1 Tax=Pisum sativum TaxID=3888 RepID=UPI0021D36000|nr:uncharacterized protein LOC127123003 [Pisum sativum]
MADQEHELERVSSELEDLRGNMGQVMEILQVIRAKLDTQTTVVSEIAGPSIEPQPARTVPTTWPTYGLPPGFTPTVEGAPGFAPPAQQTAPLPTINENHPVVHTFAPPLVRAHVQPYFEDQQHAPDFSDEDEERQEDLRGMKENYQMLEKRLRAMEGDQVFGATAKEMCLVSGLVIPAKFKTPDFDKYEGHSCPKSHLIMYYRKMAAHVEDDKLMIHCFQDSLRGAPSKWYLSLDQSRIRCFQDLSDAFIQHYKYNMDMAPDRRQLLSMSQKDKESFKEYAQRWREVASQVEPPLAEKELADWFMDTVKPVFYERMFPGGFQKKKEGDTNAVSTSQRRSQSWKKQHQFSQQQPIYPVQYVQQPYVAAVTPNYNQPQASVYQPVPAQQAPIYQQAPAPPAYQQPRAQVPRPQNPPNQNRVQRARVPFASIPMTYTELYPSLLQKGLVTPRSLGPPPNPLPPWYNPDAHCPFHGGAPGHDLEGCYALKHIVRDLVEKKILSFRDAGPNVKNNPLPAHGDVNAVEEASDVCVIKHVEDVKTPLLALHAGLVRARLIDTCHDSCEDCAIQPKGCKVVRNDIQNLMNQGVLQISGPAMNEEVSVIEPVFNIPEPLEVIYHRRDDVHPSPVVVRMPTPFPFESTKAVPWKYGITVVDGKDGEPEVAESKKSVENVDADITNIAGTSRMTRSGRIYTPNVNVNPQEPTRGAVNVNPTPEQGGAQPAVQTDEAKTSFQALEISNATLEEVKDPVEKASLSFASLKSAKSAVESGGPAGWGQVINVNEKNDRFGLGNLGSQTIKPNTELSLAAKEGLGLSIGGDVSKPIVQDTLKQESPVVSGSASLSLGIKEHLFTSVTIPKINKISPDLDKGEPVPLELSLNKKENIPVLAKWSMLGNANPSSCNKSASCPK